MLTPEQIAALPWHDEQIVKLITASGLQFVCEHCGTPHEAGFINECCRGDEFIVDGYGCEENDIDLIRHLMKSLADANLRLAAIERDGYAPAWKVLVDEAELRDLIDCGINPSKQCINCRLQGLCKSPATEKDKLLAHFGLSPKPEVTQ